MASIETIPYKILEDDGFLQIRQYEPILLASTKTKPTESGFQAVFQYISGQNQKESKISMTSPVVTYLDNKEKITGFYVPSKYNKENVPRPTGDNVFINELPASTLAVVHFSGQMTKHLYQKYHDILLDYIDSKGYQKIDNPLMMGYDPPYIDPAKKRNEIAYRVKRKDNDYE